MEDIGIGAGLGALGFWIFIAAVATAGVWDSIRKRDAQHETLRRMAESGQDIDQALLDKLLGVNDHIDRDLQIGGLILLCIAPGLAVLGWMLTPLNPEALRPLMGVAGLVLSISAGLLVASKLVARRYREGKNPASGLFKE